MKVIIHEYFEISVLILLALLLLTIIIFEVVRRIGWLEAIRRIEWLEKHYDNIYREVSYISHIISNINNNINDLEETKANHDHVLKIQKDVHKIRKACEGDESC